MRRAGGDFGWHWEPRHPAVRKLARLSGWTVGYVAANQVAFLVVLVLAYRSTGAVSVYLAAFTVYQLPHGLLAVSIMTALAPELARSHQRGDLAGLRRHFAAGLRMLLLVMVPAALGMAVLARPLVHALLDHGNFKHQYVSVTADTLAAFAIGLAAFSVYLYVVRTYTSIQNTRTPFVLNVVENGVNVATAFALWEWKGVTGLAWSWTIAYTVGAVVSRAHAAPRPRRHRGRLASSRRCGGSSSRWCPPPSRVVVIDRAIGDASFGSSVAVLALGGGGRHGRLRRPRSSSSASP